GALDLLKSLTGYTMTIQLLQATRIGVAVNSVRKHCEDEEVVASAKILIRNWKRLLAGPARRDSADSRSSSTSAASSPRKRPSGDRANGSKAKPEAPQTPTSPSFSPGPCLLAPCYLTGDSVRDKCIEMLAAALRVDDDYKEFGVNCEQMASEIEDHILWGAWGPPHIFQELKSTDMKYRNRVRSRISNLKDPKNPSLRRGVLCWDTQPSLIARMTAEHQMAKTGGTVTDLFQCGKCRKKNCTYNQVQTRSADEPMTTFVLCNECGNRWKVC
ncbi:Transcription elongation factor A protein 3, partial [Dryobates pubescens]